MPIYKVPVVWQVWGTMTVEADSIIQAFDKAIKKEPLPDGDYVDNSFEIDYEIVPLLNTLSEGELDDVATHREEQTK